MKLLKKYHISFFVLFFSTCLVFGNDLDNKKIFKLHVNPNESGNVYVFNGSQENFVLKNTYTGKQKKRSLTKLKFVDDSDIYAIKVFGKNEKYLYSIGIGNPFYANYTHIGFED